MKDFTRKSYFEELEEITNELSPEEQLEWAENELQDILAVTGLESGDPMKKTLSMSYDVFIVFVWIVKARFGRVEY